MKRTLVLLFSVFMFVFASAQTAPEPYGPTPSGNQLKWQEMQRNAHPKHLVN